MRYLFIVLIAVPGAISSAVAKEVTVPYHGITLNANLEQAGPDWQAGPVVLMTHGTLGHRGMEIMAGLQGLFAERGISSLAINLSLGLDNRAAAMYDCATPHTHKHNDAVDEIGVWQGWLQGQDVKQLALLGHSRGGNQVARYAATHDDPAITAVFLVGPLTWDAHYAAQAYSKSYQTDLQPLLTRAEKMVAEGKGAELMADVDFLYCPDASVSAAAFLSYYASDENMDTPHLLPLLKVPVTVFAGTEDTVVEGLIGEMEPLADGKQITLVKIDGADHFFLDLYSDEIADVVAEKLGVE